MVAQAKNFHSWYSIPETHKNMFVVGCTKKPLARRPIHITDVFSFSRQELELLALGLQLQPEAGEDLDHQGAQEVALRQRLPSLS